MFQIIKKVHHSLHSTFRNKKEYVPVKQWTIVEYEPLVDTKQLEADIRRVKFDILRLLEFPEMFMEVSRRHTKTQFTDTYSVLDKMFLHASIEKEYVSKYSTTKKTETNLSVEEFFQELNEDSLYISVETHTHKQKQTELIQELDIFRHLFMCLLKFPRMYMKRHCPQDDEYSICYIQEAFRKLRKIYPSYYNYFFKLYDTFNDYETRIWEHRKITLLLKLKSVYSVLPTLFHSIQNNYAKEFHYFFTDEITVINEDDTKEYIIADSLFTFGTYALVQL